MIKQAEEKTNVYYSDVCLNYWDSEYEGNSTARWKFIL